MKGLSMGQIGHKGSHAVSLSNINIDHKRKIGRKKSKNPPTRPSFPSRPNRVGLDCFSFSWVVKQGGTMLIYVPKIGCNHALKMGEIYPQCPKSKGLRDLTIKTIWEEENVCNQTFKDSKEQ